MFRQPLVVEHARQRCKRLGIAEEPGFRHHDRFNELLHFALGAAYELAISIDVRQPARADPRAHRTLNGRGTDRRGVQPHLAFQQAFQFGQCDHAGSS
jgi:hypothetical protein